MFCKSGIFIFAENNYLIRQYIHPHHVLIKHLCSIRALVPMTFFSLSPPLSLFQADPLECRGWVHFPAQASKTLSRRHSAPSPHREGAWGLHEQSKPHAGALLAFCVNQGISASFSLLYFLIGWLRTTKFSPLKDLNWLDLLAVQGTLKSLLQHHSSKASILRHSAFIVQLSYPYVTME